MAHNDFKRYVWLIALLYNSGGASFKDIDLDWQDQPELNPEGEPLPNRTFNKAHLQTSVGGLSEEPA